jgi:hypothetical protein
MIVAESDGEYYLAISRRIALNDRMKLFELTDLENVMSKQDSNRLPCRDNVVDFKGWVVSSYKREIHGLRGSIFKGDFRKSSLPAASEGQEFDYTLLVSDSNEHAIEIEKYTDGRIEVYATVYRRLNDVGEITHPTAAGEMKRPDIKLASAPELAAKEPAPVIASISPVMSSSATPANILAEPAKTTPIKLQEFAAPSKPETPIAPVSAPVAETKSSTTTTETTINGARNDMSTAEAMKPKLYVQPTVPETYGQQEIKAVSNKAIANGFDADAIECDLRVANKIIDEAIRNEMRLTDIVRRIIELPVAYPESVQIPLTLTDEDYALLAIRYGISSSDRNAIKRRIIEDLNDFSGDKKKAA